MGVRSGSIPVPSPETVHVAATHGHTRGHAISVRAVLKPKPDLQRLVKALLSIEPEQLDELRKRMAG